MHNINTYEDALNRWESIQRIADYAPTLIAFELIESVGTHKQTLEHIGHTNTHAGTHRNTLNTLTQVEHIDSVEQHRTTMRTLEPWKSLNIMTQIENMQTHRRILTHI